MPPRRRPGRARVHADLIDWEADPRPLGEALKAWHRGRGQTRDQAAAEFRLPRSTYDGWCAGRMPASEGMVRRFMTLLERQDRWWSSRKSEWS